MSIEKISEGVFQLQEKNLDEGPFEYVEILKGMYQYRPSKSKTQSEK